MKKAINMIARDSCFPNTFNFRTRGVEKSDDCSINPEILPISVLSAIETTTPRPCPCVTKVPAKTIFNRSARGISTSATTSLVFLIESDSPVRADSSTCKFFT